MSQFRDRCLAFVVVAALSGCGAETVDSAPPSAPETSKTANPLEAAGKQEFFVTIPGFAGESTSMRRRNSIPAIRFYANIIKPDTGATKCSSIRFTKAAGVSDPLFLKAMAAGQTLPTVTMEFVKPSIAGTEFVWQQLTLTGMRVSRVEQAVAPPDDLSPSVVLEEVTFEPNNTATLTLTSTAQNSDGNPGAPLTTSFTCSR